jgi:hypothetical protein
MKKIGGAIAACLALFSLGLAPAWADEISDQLDKGLKLYQQGKLSEALQEVEFAAAQMRQKKAEGYAAVFPEPPAGWQAEKVEYQAMGQALFGGGISASRAYRKGEAEVRLEVLSDSPLVQPLVMGLSNPALMQAQGQKLIRVGDQRAILQEDDDTQAEVLILFEGKILIKVEARGSRGAAEVAKDFAGKVNLAKLRELSR